MAALKNNGHRINAISYVDYNTAEQIMRYLEGTMLSLFKKGEIHCYAEIIDQMKMSVIADGTSIRDLVRNHKKLFGATAAEAMKRLEVLHKHNYLRIIREHKSYKIAVNPNINRG